MGARPDGAWWMIAPDRLRAKGGSWMTSSVPENLSYTDAHEWVEQNGEVCRVGLTDFAQKELGEVVFVELPEVGRHLEVGEPFGTVESVKAVSELYAPVTGEIVTINEDLRDSPEYVNDDPYGDGWFIEIKAVDVAAAGLLSAADYTAHLRESAGD